MTATAPDRKSQRRTAEPLALWVAYSLGSVVIHLLALTTLQRMMVRQETVELSNTNIPIEIVEITPQTSSLKPPNVLAKESDKAIAPLSTPEAKNEAIAPLSTPEAKNEAIAPLSAPEPTLETKNEVIAPPSAPEPTLETKNEAIAPKEEEIQEPPSLPKPAEIKKANYQQNSSVIAKSESFDPSVSSESTVERVETKPRTKVKTPTKTRSKTARTRSARVSKYVKRIPLQERSRGDSLEPKRRFTENVDANSTKTDETDEPAQTAPLANENLSASTEPKKRTPVTPVVSKLLPTRSPSPDSSQPSDSSNIPASPEESDSQNSAKETGSSSNPSPAIPAPQEESANDRPKANANPDKPAKNEEKKSSEKDSPASTTTRDRSPEKSKPVASAPPATESPKSEEDSRGLVATLSDVRLANGGRDNPDRVAKPRQSQKQFDSIDYPSRAKGKQNRVLLLEVKLLIDDKGNPEVQSAQVVKGTSSVSPRQLASEVIQGWKFEPAYQAKQPVYSNMEVVLRIAPLAN